jgi:hypothetical protein
LLVSHARKVIEKLVDMLDKVDQMITDTPPVPQQGRFGNIAFRTLHQALVSVRPIISRLDGPFHQRNREAKPCSRTSYPPIRRTLLSNCMDILLIPLAIPCASTTALV